MKRKLKWVSLVACGGVVLQVASCAPILADLLLQQVYVTVLKAILEGVVGTNSNSQ